MPVEKHAASGKSLGQKFSVLSALIKSFTDKGDFEAACIIAHREYSSVKWTVLIDPDTLVSAEFHIVFR
ncbi:hypothetical protein D3C85_1942370 [compost metagenome]